MDMSVPALNEIRTTRYLKVKPEALWRGLTEERILVSWFRPGGAELAGAKIDPRPGGRFDLMRARAGAQLEKLTACVLDAQPARRFAITTALGADYLPTGDTRPATLVLDLHEIASGTRIEGTLMVADGVDISEFTGWDSGLGTLEAIVSE